MPHRVPSRRRPLSCLPSVSVVILSAMALPTCVFKKSKSEMKSFTDSTSGLLFEKLVSGEKAAPQTTLPTSQPSPGTTPLSTDTASAFSSQVGVCYYLLERGQTTATPVAPVGVTLSKALSEIGIVLGVGDTKLVTDFEATFARALRKGAEQPTLATTSGSASSTASPGTATGAMGLVADAPALHLAVPVVPLFQKTVQLFVRNPKALGTMASGMRTVLPKTLTRLGRPELLQKISTNMGSLGLRVAEKVPHFKALRTGLLGGNVPLDVKISGLVTLARDGILHGIASAIGLKVASQVLKTEPSASAPRAGAQIEADTLTTDWSALSDAAVLQAAETLAEKTYSEEEISEIASIVAAVENEMQANAVPAEGKALEIAAKIAELAKGDHAVAEACPATASPHADALAAQTAAETEAARMGAGSGPLTNPQAGASPIP